MVAAGTPADGNPDRIGRAQVPAADQGLRRPETASLEVVVRPRSACPRSRARLDLGVGHGQALLRPAPGVSPRPSSRRRCSSRDGASTKIRSGVGVQRLDLAGALDVDLEDDVACRRCRRAVGVPCR